MVAIFTGAGAGFTRGSANILGGAGQFGNASLGRGGENVSVNAATGNLLIGRQDEFLVGRGPDIGISRTYNSLADTSDGDNGDNWQQSTTRRVFGLTGTVNATGSTVSRLGADGAVIVYAWDAARGAYVTSAGEGAFDTLAFADDLWTWRDGGSQATESYAAYGMDTWRIVSASDIDGNSLTWSYLGDKLDKVTTADGAWTQYVWSGNAIAEIVTGYTDLATVTAQTLTRTRYAYDASNRLVMVTTDLSPADGSVADGQVYTVSYTYDGVSNRIASIAQSDGSLLAIVYDASGRVQTLTQTVAGGDVRVTSLAYATGYTEVTGPDGQVTRLGYDAAGQLTAITAPPAYAGAAAQQVQFAYDTAGNLVSVTDARGKVMAYQYDANGNVTQVTDANGNIVQRTYDAANRLITELVHGADETGPSAAHYAQYAYDAEGHLRFAVDAAGQVTEYLYSAEGELTYTRRYAEHAFAVGPTPLTLSGMLAWRDGLGDLSSVKLTRYIYDARGNLTQELRYGTASATGGSSTADGYSRTYYTYDQAGQLLARNREGELAETFVYDGMGRLVASTDVHGGTTTIVFNDTALTTTVTTAAGYVSISAYNKAGELVSRTDSGANTAGGTASYQYDKNGRLRIVTDATGRTSYTIYDKAGRKVADIDHLGAIVEYRYDQADRLIATIRYATVLGAAQLAVLADPNNGADLSTLLPTANAADQWNWTVYDDGGRVLQSIASDGSVAAFEYDEAGHVVRTTGYYTRLTQAQLDGFKLTSPAAPVLPTAHAKDAVTRQFYNKAGQLVGSLDGKGFLSEIVYDAAGQKVREIAYAATTTAADRANGSFATLRGQVAGASTVDRVMRYVYDGQGQLRYTVDGLGGVTGFAYDKAGRLTTTTQYATPFTATDFTYDAVQAGVVTTTADRTSYTVYDASGRAAYAVDAEGGVTGYSYDSSGWVTKAIQFADLYNAVADLPSLTAMNGWASDPAQANDSANRITRSWYSERGELLFTVDAGNYVRGFTYDAQGRKIGETAWPNGVVVADSATSAQVAALAAGAGSPIALSYSYDSAGRLLTSTDGEGIVSRHVYNALGQLTDTYLADNVAADTVRLHYAYDAAGRLIAEYRAYGAAEQMGSSYAYDGLGNRTGATDANGNTTTYAYDALGRVVSATNALGGVTAYEYDAFGNVLKVTDPKGNVSFNYYDALNRLVATRDASGYVTRTLYNRFGDVLSVERYSVAIMGAGQAGVAVFDPLQVPTDPFAYANSLQAIADGLDAQANQAETAATQAQANATAAVQAAADADTVVSTLQAQLDALGGQPVDFSAERAAALANPTVWINNRSTWLMGTSAPITNLTINSQYGAYQSELSAIQSYYINEGMSLITITTTSKKNSYINKFYDNLTNQRIILSADKAGALADPVAWLQARKADLLNWIAAYSGFTQSSSFDYTAKEQWLSVVQAIYDLTNNTYSTGWPLGISLYTSVQANPAYVPSGLTHTTTQAANYRALAIINAYYDVQGVIADPYGALTTAQQQQLQFQAQLNQATAASAAAHNAAVAAQTNATTAAATAAQLRVDAIQAQEAADAAYAAAQANSGVALRDTFVVLDLAQLGAPAVTKFGYDSLGRVVWKVDAEGYPEFYEYNAFGQQVAIARYSQAMAGGQVPNPDAALTPQTIAAYDQAAQLQVAADAAAAQLANVQAARAAALANPLPHLQDHLAGLNAQLATLNAELAVLQTQYNNANIIDQWLVYGPKITAKNNEITAKQTAIAAVQAEIQRVQNGQGLTSLGTGIIQAKFDPAQLEAQYLAAQSAADQALANAQTLEAQSKGMGGVQSLTQFVYDNRGQAIRITDAEGFFETFAYDAFGRRVGQTAKSSSATKVAGGITTYTYDKRGLLLTETSPVASYTSAGTVQAATVTSRYIYDARGNRIATIEANGLSEQRRTDYTYDKLDRLVETKGDTVTGLTINATTKAASSISGRPTETIAYDACGNIVTTVDAAGAKTVFFYDELNRKVAEIDALGTYSAYQYDANGNVTRIRVYDTAVAVPAAGGKANQAPAVPAGAYRETLFAYDSLNRLVESQVTGVTTGSVSGSSWSSSTAAIRTTYQYNYLGNVAQVTDPNGNKTWSYYDKLGRKVAQVDGQNYLTKWTLDSEGNVTEERRYATAVTTPGSTATPPTGTNNAADRITQYTYDRNGRRLSETRLNVQFHNGSGGYSTGSATIAYLYNGLGQVIRRTEATGDQTNYTYDAGGRLSREVKAQSAVNYYYDGFGNLIRNVQAAVNGSSARTTTYAYGAGGRLASMTDAGGYVHSYYYDVAGRVVLESYVRANAAGGSSTEAVGHRYDVLGRNLGQAYYVKSGSNWNFQSGNDYSTLQYNAYGDVTKIGINGLWQQENKYDAAGRVWATNSGDGVWKYYGYDKNGNQTLAVTSAGTNLAGLASITAAYAQVGQASVNGTITVYDGRNLATSVLEEGRELGGSTVQLTTTRSYNAFGEVAAETNANNATFTYTYNTMGRVIAVQSPQVSITTEAGVTQNVLPTQYFYYDKSGRLTGQRDANGNLTRYDLLAGSGYGGSKALVTKETHADGGTVSTAYNVHGDAVQVTDEVGLVTAMGYDNLGRLTQVNNPGGLIDYYGYDVLGQRLTHYNSLLGAGDKEITGYDIQGRIVSQQSFGNDTTTTSYVWSGAIATAGLGTFGGWTETTTYANGKTVIDKSDVFQRAVQHTDMGGFVTDYSYDAAGRMVQAATALSGSTSTSSMAYAYYNTGLLKQTTLSYVTQTYYWTGSTVIFGQQTNTVGATYTYDKSGNRLTEVGTSTVNGTATTWKNQSATYDALGRLKTWSEAGTATSPASSISYYYDAAGNVRRSTATYRTLDATGAAASTASTQDYWFRYDSMNRLVIDRGVLSGSTIQRSITTTASKEILYDKAGRRTNVLSTLYTPGMYNEYIGYLPGTYQDQREIYTYDAAGRLAQVDVALGEAAMEQYTGTPPTTLPAAPITGARRASYAYDGMGRLTSQKDYEADGNTVAYDRALTYNAKSQLVSEIAITKRGADLYKSISAYDYGTGTNYALGSVLSVVSQNFKNNNDSAAKDTSTVNTYAWRDGAVQNTITVDNDTTSSSNALYTTTMYYNAAGRLMSAYISDGKPRSVAYTLDENAQIIRRDETRPTNAPSYQTGSPHEAWYRFGGREMGYVGNNGTSDLAYGASIAERQIVQASNPGTFRNGSTYAQNYADFAQSYDPINSYSQGASGGSYTVRTGDSLQSIAQAVWGDANLWYKLAEANGISGNAGLIEGQVIQLPAGVIRNAHNAGTVSPYNPAEAIGDVSPTTAPKPPKKKGCGGLGMVLLAVVAVAVAIVLPEAIPVIKDLGPVVAGAISGATGSVVSQGIGLATGLQSKFSFKGVALAALGGAVGGGVGKVNPLGAKAGELINDVARGVLGGSLTQGIAVATGLQSKFDFAGVAAAAVGAGVGGAVARGLPNSGVFSAPFGSDFTSTMASAIAGAATRSAIEGSSFGTNLTRALPNAIGQAMGRALARAVIGSPNRVDSGIRIDPDVTDEITRQLDGSAPVAEATSLNAAIVASPVARSGMTIGQHLANGVMAQLGVAPSDAEIEAEIVVVASRQSLNDHRYISDGQFRPIDATARLRGWEPAQENAYVHQIAVSNMFLGHFAQPPSASAVIGGSLGVVRAFAGGAMDALSGIVDLTLDAMNPGRPGAWERNIVRGRAVTSGEIITAPVNQYIDALDALFDSDDPRLLARMAGGSLVSTGLGTVLGNTGRVGGTADVLPSIEALYQVRYAAAYERGIIEVNSDIAAGIIRAPKGQPEHLFFANRVDDLARRDLKRFALEQGHGTDLVRINQRLYLEGTSGPYRIPDLYFPQSGIILDGTLGFKTARTPQIIDFRAANNNAPIRIVRPESYGGSYWVGK